MTTYPAFIVCPKCLGVATNVTVPFHQLLELSIQGKDPDRMLLRTDLGKPGPSNHLIVCQHCHFAFKSSQSGIVDRPRTVPPHASTTTTG